MYAPLLANRYLTSRIIPFIAVAAVALCVALVIVVVSVMSGFLEMVRASGKTMTGDVVVTRPITGIPYYQDLIKEIESLPEAAAASPIVETFGLLQMQYGTGDGGKQIEMVEVWGIDPASLDRVADYSRKLYWSKPADAALAPTTRCGTRSTTARPTACASPPPMAGPASCSASRSHRSTGGVATARTAPARRRAHRRMPTTSCPTRAR